MAIDAEFIYHQQVLLCVCMHTRVRNCTHLELRILYIREHATNYIYFPNGNFRS